MPHSDSICCGQTRKWHPFFSFFRLESPLYAVKSLLGASELARVKSCHDTELLTSRRGRAGLVEAITLPQVAGDFVARSSSQIRVSSGSHAHQKARMSLGAGTEAHWGGRKVAGGYDPL